jgi:hypothetical protein
VFVLDSDMAMPSPLQRVPYEPAGEFVSMVSCAGFGRKRRSPFGRIRNKPDQNLFPKTPGCDSEVVLASTWSDETVAPARITAASAIVPPLFR